MNCQLSINGGYYAPLTHFVKPPFAIKNDSTRGLIVDIGRKTGILQ